MFANTIFVLFIGCLWLYAQNAWVDGRHLPVFNLSIVGYSILQLLCAKFLEKCRSLSVMIAFDEYECPRPTLDEASNRFIHTASRSTCIETFMGGRMCKELTITCISSSSLECPSWVFPMQWYLLRGMIRSVQASCHPAGVSEFLMWGWKLPFWKCKPFGVRLHRYTSTPFGLQGRTVSTGPPGH
jgi:hypothetical protein